MYNLLFPISLIYVCRFVLPVIEDPTCKSSAKVLTIYEKKKKLDHWKKCVDIVVQ